ncbi:NBR1-Ig-like domain-containing protein [Nanoarchaeota archaeon]
MKKSVMVLLYIVCFLVLASVAFAYCGDDDCNGPETCVTCPVDCGRCECDPGDSQTRDCGNCGWQWRDCLPWGEWDDWSHCVDEGSCSPGDWDSRNCGNCGRQDRQCGSNCEWRSWGSCYDQGDCSPGDSQTRDCGWCGEQSRTCRNNCQWRSWGDCENQGECAPGSSQTRDCNTGIPGICAEGDQSRTCRNNCNWRNWGDCEPEYPPTTEICDNLDNDCDGEEDEVCSTCISTTIPASMGAGETRSVSVTFRNDGNVNWIYNIFRLRSIRPDFNNRWGISAVTMIPGSNVGENEQYTFTFDITAPSTPGTYDCWWRMIRASPEWYWLDDECGRAVTVEEEPDDNDAECVSHTFPSTMEPGESRVVTVTMRNSGTTTWNTIDGHKLGLWSQNVWGITRVDLPLGVLPPGQTVTYSFTITAPSTEGTYNSLWRMIQEGVEWFGPTCGRAITVEAEPDDNDAECVAHTIPSTLEPGESRAVTVTMRNTGTTTWTQADLYRLGIWDENVWGITRVNLPLSFIAPGGTATFSFTITAPSTAGDYDSFWRMLEETVEWFGESCGRTVTVEAEPENDAECVGHTIPATMDPSETRTVTVTMRNTGTTSWTIADLYRLGIWDENVWGITRVVLPSSPVNPGETVTFSFTITSPASTGSYDSFWRMLEEGVEWFGDSCGGEVTIEEDGENDAECMTHTIPATMEPGETRPVQVAMRNTGTTTWTQADLYRLGIWSQNVWGVTRVNLPLSFIAPGGIATFSFDITAPSTEGTYNSLWRMLEEGVEWFGPTCGRAVVVEAAPENDAECVAHTIPPQIEPGESVDVTVTMRNTGTSIWTQADLYRLGIWDENVWGITRVDLPFSSVIPGQTVTFSFTITAPSTEGDYDSFWRMLEETVEWFGDTCGITVSVEDDPCDPGDIETQSCGFCGTRTRECLPSGVWGPWSNCFNPGVCYPGEFQSRFCGTNVGECTRGLETRFCEATCLWGGFYGCNATGPWDEICDDGLDNDCDGYVDEGCTVDCELEQLSLRGEGGEIQYIGEYTEFQSSDIDFSAWIREIDFDEYYGMMSLSVQGVLANGDRIRLRTKGKVDDVNEMTCEVIDVNNIWWSLATFQVGDDPPVSITFDSIRYVWDRESGLMDIWGLGSYLDFHIEDIEVWCVNC